MGTIATPQTQSRFRPQPSFSDDQIEQVARGTRTDIARWVRKVVQQRNALVHSRPTDLFAKAASRLSDADVELDATEKLLIDLARAHIITPFQRGLLQVKYLR